LTLLPKGFLTLREEHRLKVLENRVQRRVLILKKVENGRKLKKTA
jgi:hypothetical protein